MRYLPLLLLLSGCDVLFPDAPDPCPTPPEQHPEAWKAVPMKDAAGNVIAYSFVCATGLVASVARKPADSATIHIIFRRP